MYIHIYIFIYQKKLNSQGQKIFLLHKIYKWRRIPQLGRLKQRKRRKLIKTYLLYKVLKEKERKETNLRRIWVAPIFSEKRRNEQGASNNLIKEIKNTDLEKFFEFMRMDTEAFNELLKIIEPNITKQNAVRNSVPATTRMEICLRYLAQGDTMQYLSFAFRGTTNTVSKIVAETFQAIWSGLKDAVFSECTENMQIQTAKEFQDIWDFPNCIGAIDGKHIELQVHIIFLF